MRQPPEGLLSERLRPSFVTISADQALDHLQIRRRLPGCGRIVQNVMLQDSSARSADPRKVQLCCHSCCCKIRFGGRRVVPYQLTCKLTDLGGDCGIAAQRTRQPMPQRVAAGPRPAFSGGRAPAPGGISPVGRNLLLRTHEAVSVIDGDGSSGRCSRVG
jgi:hypothetical protein